VPEFLLERGRPQEALAASQELVKCRWAMGRFAGHSLAGRALLALDRIEDARSELALAEQEMEHLPAQVIKSLQDTVMLRAEIMLREKNWDKGNVLMQQVEEQVVAVPGPDAWSGPSCSLIPLPGSHEISATGPSGVHCAEDDPA